MWFFNWTENLVSDKKTGETNESKNVQWTIVCWLIFSVPVAQELQSARYTNRLALICSFFHLFVSYKHLRREDNYASQNLNNLALESKLIWIESH